MQTAKQERHDAQLKALKAKYLKAKASYYNSKPIMTDAEFDALEDRIIASVPEWDQLAKTGVAVANKKTEVALLKFMPSLNKAYPEKIEMRLKSMLKAYPTAAWIVMAKLDGSSLQVVYDKGVPKRVITRGDGTRGGDISFLIPYLNLPKKINVKTQVVFRCEAVLSALVFKLKWRKEFDNARNMVAGLLNRREPHPALADVDIVVLGVYDMPLDDGLNFARTQGFETVFFNTPGVRILDCEVQLKGIKLASPYAADGIVIAPSKHVLSYADAEKPKFMVAYKENESVADAQTAIVEDIIYQTSSSKRIIPKAKLKPVVVGGVTVTYATLHNAQWMIDRKIGPGAKVKIVRSGDVIPKIVGVVKASAVKYPDVKHELRGVHFVALTHSTEIAVRTLLRFFDKLGIEFIKAGTVEALYTQGYKTPFDYMNLVKHGDASLLVKAGLGKVQATKQFDELTRVLGRPVNLLSLMVASCVFDSGVGERKLAAINKHLGYQALATTFKFVAAGNKMVPGVVEYDRLLETPGFQTKTVRVILDGMRAFKPWLRKTLQFITVEKSRPEEARIIGKLTHHKVCFTGYRDAAHEAAVKRAGGEVVSFGKSVTILLYKKGKESSKLDKALAAGARVCMFADLGIKV